jgi:predicted polyphosphate/ATP-dependent NAD kinase
MGILKYRPHIVGLMRIGFLVNPIAGIGGRVGLKGSDNVEKEARRRGAKPVSPDRAKEALIKLISLLGSSIKDVRFLTCAGVMGKSELLRAGAPLSVIEIVHRPPKHTSAKDTEIAAKAFAETGVDVILFCGGDGTARDIVKVVGRKFPLVGIPAGVKMHSGVFCTRPENVAFLLQGFINGRIGLGEAEILDLDEEKYRKGKWVVRLFGAATTLQEPNLVQAGKMMVAEIADEAIKDEMGEYLSELIEKEPQALFILGPGSTISRISKKLKVDKTLLGIDAVVDREQVGKDLDEKKLLGLLDKHKPAYLAVSPIGAQGFILGRGNLQLSPKVVRRIGISNIIVFATPSKLQVTPTLRADTGDAKLDSELARKEYLRVIVGYRTMRMHPLQV